MSAGPAVRRKGRTMSRGVWGTVLIGVFACCAWQSDAAEEGAATGLRGIAPANIPADLIGNIEQLPESWKSWGDALTTELETLYEKEGVDAAGERQAIAALRGRLSTIRKSLADPRYKSITTPLVGLHGGLQRRIDLAEAALDSLQLGPAVKQARVDAAGRQLAQAAASLDAYLRSIRNGTGWVTYLEVGAIRTAAVNTLVSAQSKLKGKDSLPDARARDFLHRPEFASYEAALDRYLAATNAPEINPNSPELRKGLAELFSAVEEYEMSRASASSAGVRKAFDAVRAIAPDGGDRIAAALRANYLNYNLRVVATEAFLNKFFSQTRTESGEVVDFILGANVYGSQVTATTVSLDLRPSGSTARFAIRASGAVSSSTSGTTDQAVVYTQGNHYFTADKVIDFNGERFITYPATIGVSANNNTYDATTNYSGIPILGGIANNIALSEAAKKRGESEAIAASRVQDRVLPKFNAEVDKEFGPNGTRNVEMQTKVIGPLQELELYPDAKSYSTTDSELHVRTRLMADSELGGSDPNPALLLGRGATILVHESLLNNSTDRMRLAGRTMTDDEVQAELEARLTKLLGREVKFKKEGTGNEEEEGPKTFVFDKADPIRFHVADGALLLTIRAGFKQAGKEDIPTQIITVPLTFSVDMKNVVINSGNVSISPVEQPDSAATQIARAGVIKKKIQSALPTREVDRVAEVDHAGRKIVTAVTRIRALDGWLSITFE
jgi:hypothetical protein